MSSRDSSRSTAAPVAAVSQLPASNNSDGSSSNYANANVNFAARQITLTQTLTNGGSITTAIVTLDRGTPPTETAAPSDQESSSAAASSGGMPPQTIGIIVGCSVGVVVLILAVALCCVAMRRRAAAAAAAAYSDGYSDDDRSGMGQPPGMYLGPGGMQMQRPWQFPRSIPPPTLRPGEMPYYRARAPPRQYTAHDPAERGYI
ncbi:hypothetical protein MGN70_013134 [Eutypa lata]|nr:hypothetical protein MGN70_013134 [Eutypa lata]